MRNEKRRRSGSVTSRVETQCIDLIDDGIYANHRPLMVRSDDQSFLAMVEEAGD